MFLHLSRFSLFRCVARIASDRRAITALEYGVITAAITLGIVGALGSLKEDLTNLFNNIGANL